ncbi:MAG TPA: sigma-70 family RNA polymerase sigma factor [Acidimicrobiia bacterium]|nr:sigma-70 family RNA polymerase sigma factor [Acidimicrobiia bacterium]
MAEQFWGAGSGQVGDTVVAPFPEDGFDLGDAGAETADSGPLMQRSAEIDLDLEEAFEHRAELVEICRRIVGDASLAEDVVQETYVQAVRNSHKLERRDGLMPWLVTVATRRSLNELRRRKYSTTFETMPERETAPEFDPCVAVTLTDEFDRVNSIMSTLTNRERDLLMRQVYDGLSLVELAEIEGTTAASVRSVLSRARGKLRAALADTKAWALAPLSAVGGWTRRRLSAIHGRIHEAGPMLPAGQERLKELLVGAASVALAVGGSAALPDASSSPLGTPAIVAPAIDATPGPTAQALAAIVGSHPAMVDGFEAAARASAGTAGSGSESSAAWGSPTGGQESDGDLPVGTDLDTNPDLPDGGSDGLGGTLPPPPAPDDDLKAPDPNGVPGDLPNGVPTPDPDDAPDLGDPTNPLNDLPQDSDELLESVDPEIAGPLP